MCVIVTYLHTASPWTTRYALFADVYLSVIHCPLRSQISKTKAFHYDNPYSYYRTLLESWHR